MNCPGRITHNPRVMGGRPCVRGLRITVAMIVRQIGIGRSIDELLADYPYLEREDILQALRYAGLAGAGTRHPRVDEALRRLIQYLASSEPAWTVAPGPQLRAPVHDGRDSGVMADTIPAA